MNAPWDAMAGGAVLNALIGHGRAPAEFARGLSTMTGRWFAQDVGALAHEADNGLASWGSVEAAYERYAMKADAATAFSKQWLDDSSALRAWVPALEGVAKVAGGAALVGDVGTLVSPEDHGTMGWVDRGAAAANGGLVAADLALGGIPVVGEAALVATGVYLGGDYLYHHWKPFHDVADTVGHTTVSVAKDLGSGLVSGAKSVAGLFG